jgi:hypothetical protein
MADITVRKIRFSFEEPIDFDVSDETLSTLLPMLALSMTMPYLEPYLIRTMKAALKEITDPQLAEDARRFSQQEGHHYRNHARLNDQLRWQFAGDTPDRLRAIEDALEADYQRFTREKSLRFNDATGWRDLGLAHGRGDRAPHGRLRRLQAPRRELPVPDAGRNLGAVALRVLHPTLRALHGGRAGPQAARAPHADTALGPAPLPAHLEPVVRPREDRRSAQRRTAARQVLGHGGGGAGLRRRRP